MERERERGGGEREERGRRRDSKVKNMNYGKERRNKRVRGLLQI